MNIVVVGIYSLPFQKPNTCNCSIIYRINFQISSILGKKHTKYIYGSSYIFRKIGRINALN